MLNSLKSRQIDMAYSLTYSQIADAKSADKKVLNYKTGSYPMIEMRTDVEPFKDQRVRRAFQLMVDRKRVSKNAYSGHASLGNDYMAGGEQCGKPKVHQRKQDIRKARNLLKAAGKSNIKVDLVTDDAVPGMKESAEVLAQGAKAAGVKVNVRKLSTADFLDRWGKWPFYVNDATPPYVVGSINHFKPKGLDNSTHFNNKGYKSLLSQLSVTEGRKGQCSLVRKMHENVYRHGGEIIPSVPKRTTAFAPSIKGIKGDAQGRAAYMFGDVTIE